MKRSSTRVCAARSASPAGELWSVVGADDPRQPPLDADLVEYPGDVQRRDRGVGDDLYDLLADPVGALDVDRPAVNAQPAVQHPVAVAAVLTCELLQALA